MTNDIILTTTGGGSITITPNGAVFSGEITSHDWRFHMQSLRGVQRGYKKVLSDMVRYGIEHFGEAEVQGTMEQLRFDLGDAKQALVVAALPQSLTEGSLSLEHQYVLGKELETHEEREKWAKIAEEEKLSPADLKTSIEVGEVSRAKDRQKGLLSFELVLGSFIRCKKNYDVTVMSKQQREQIAALLLPITEYRNQLLA